MKIAFIPRAEYSIGQTIVVHGEPMIIESRSHTGRNLIACTLTGAAKFSRVACICIDSENVIHAQEAS